MTRCMTKVQRVIFNAGAWMPRPTPRRAIMPCSVTVEGDTSALVPDLCHELARAIDWAVYGETVIPADAAPRGVITEASGEHVYGGMLISLDPEPAGARSTVRPTRSLTCQRSAAYTDAAGHDGSGGSCTRSLTGGPRSAPSCLR